MTDPANPEIVSDRRLVKRHTGNEPAKVDLSLFDALCPELDAQVDKANLNMDRALSVLWLTLHHAFVKIKKAQEVEDLPDTPENERLRKRYQITVGDAEKAARVVDILWRTKTEMEKLLAEKDKKSLNEIYRTQQALGDTALAEAKRIQSEFSSKKLKKEQSKEGGTDGLQTAETV